MSDDLISRRSSIMASSSNSHSGVAAAAEEKRPVAASSERLEALMGHGRFQLIQIWVFLSTICYISALNYFHLIFSVSYPSYRCALPQHMEINFQYDAFFNYSDLVGKCELAQLSPSCINRSFATAEEMVLQNCFDPTQKVPCTDMNGYVFDMNASDAFWSLSTEYGWVCDKEALGPDLLTARLVGQLVSALVFMQLSDVWGRHAVIQVINVIYIVLNIIAVFISNHYYAMIIIYGIGSTFSPLGLRVAYILVSEFCNDRGRYQAYISSWTFWVIGGATLPAICYLCGDWFSYGLAIPLVNVVILSFIWLTPESPRLLLTRGKIDKAKKIILKIRRINKQTHIPENYDAEVEEIANLIKNEKPLGVVSLFQNRTLAYYTILLCITWLINDFLYVGGPINLGNLAGNQYFNFAAIVLTDFPSVFVGELSISRLGRRWSNVGFMFLATLFYALSSLYSSWPDQEHVVTGLTITARACGNVAWFIMWVQVVEIFPTSVRVSGTILASVVAGTVSISAPYVVLLGQSNLPLMYVIFASFGVLGIMVTSFLPETLNEPLAECVDDLVARKKHPFFSWRVWSKT